jgi:hypothetical protein
MGLYALRQTPTKHWLVQVILLICWTTEAIGDGLKWTITIPEKETLQKPTENRPSAGFAAAILFIAASIYKLR